MMKQRCLAVALLAFLALSGCITQDFPQVGSGSLTEDTSDGPSSDVGDTTTEDGGDDDADSSSCETAADCEGGENASPRCNTETNTCELQCDDGFDDCDGDWSNGCEVALDTIDHCGSCDNKCPTSAGDGYLPVCADGGVCETDKSQCAEGFADVDGDLGTEGSNGCECSIESRDDEPDDGRDNNCDGVDGTVAAAVFVSEDGSDENEGLTPEDAVRTIAKGLSIAAAKGRSYLLLTGGTYHEQVTLESGISIYGGYEKDDWSRPPAGGPETIIAPGSDAFAEGETHYRSVIAENLSEPTTLDRLTIRGFDASGSSNLGASTYAVWVYESEGLEIENSHIEAGDAAAGDHGMQGSSRNDPSCNADGGAGASRNTASLSCPSPGAAPSGDTGADGSPSGSGGLGGNGGAHYCVQSLSGCNNSEGNPGTNGDDGVSGSNGSPGTPHGKVVEGQWLADSGDEPVDGDDGGGGGGGGAGGDCAYLGTTGRGGHGGQGGAGGCGATHGENGQTGGASFAVFVSQSSAELDSVEITQGRGGQGGNGGNGGEGQSAPNTGYSGGDGADSAGGARGGDGGLGGDGGHGGAGAGGCGGPSIGVAIVASDVTADVNYTKPSDGAQGGNGGSHHDDAIGDAPEGCTGAVETLYEFSTAAEE